MAVLGITGAGGFIGSELVRIARSSGHELRLFARAREGMQSLDLTAPKINAALLAGCDAIIHLAARLPFSATDEVQARECWEVNALGTLKLIGAMVEAGVVRLIHASSANAYAPWCSFPDEDAPLYPTHRVYYLGSKVMQEFYANAYGGLTNLRISCVRLSSVYGASEQNTVGGLGASLLRREKVKIANGGVFGADFIHVSDVAQAILLVHSLEQDGNFNVASGYRRTMSEVATSLCEITGADPQLIEIEAQHPGAFRGYPAINIGKIRKLGFVPTDFEAGLRKVVADLKEGRGT